jgi:hypothetical protein
MREEHQKNWWRRIRRRRSLFRKGVVDLLASVATALQKLSEREALLLEQFKRKRKHKKHDNRTK